MWGLGFLTSTGRWLDTLVIAIFVLDRTESPFLVASMLMLRFLPMALFGLFTGVIAQRVNRHTVLRYTTGLIVLVALAIYWLAAVGVLEVWHLGAASFISGLVWATDFSARRTLMGELAGPARISRPHQP